MKILAFNEDCELKMACTSNAELAEARRLGYNLVDCTNGDGALQAMLDLQSQFQRRLGIFQGDTQYIMNHILYAEAEMHEMLRELEGFKAWKTYNWNDDEQAEHLANAKEEFIDVLHFIWNVALALNLDADEIIQIYADKNITNHLRQDNGY